MAMPFVGRVYESNGPSRMADLIRRRGERRGDAIRQQGQNTARTWSAVGELTSGMLTDLVRGREQQRELDRVKREQGLKDAERDTLKLTANLPPAQRVSDLRAAGYGEHADRIEDQQLTREANQMRVGEAKREIAERDTIRLVMGSHLVEGKNGVKTYDRKMITEELSKAGLSDRVPEILKNLDTIDAASANARRAKIELREAQDRQITHLAQTVRALGDTPQAFESAAAVMLANETITEDDLKPYFDAIDQGGPDAVRRITTSIMERGSRPTTGGGVTPNMVQDAEQWRHKALDEARERYEELVANGDSNETFDAKTAKKAYDAEVRDIQNSYRRQLGQSPLPERPTPAPARAYTNPGSSRVTGPSAPVEDVTAGPVTAPPSTPPSVNPVGRAVSASGPGAIPSRPLGAGTATAARPPVRNVQGATNPGSVRVTDATTRPATPAPAPSRFSVTAPDGKTYVFPTQAAADEFRRRIAR